MALDRCKREATTGYLYVYRISRTKARKDIRHTKKISHMYNILEKLCLQDEFSNIC